MVLFANPTLLILIFFQSQKEQKCERKIFSFHTLQCIYIYISHFAIYCFFNVEQLKHKTKSRCNPKLLIKCMQIDVFYLRVISMCDQSCATNHVRPIMCDQSCATNHVRPMRFTVFYTPIDSSDKIQLMCSTILLCLLIL